MQSYSWGQLFVNNAALGDMHGIYRCMESGCRYVEIYANEAYYVALSRGHVDAADAINRCYCLVNHSMFLGGGILIVNHLHYQIN